MSNFLPSDEVVKSELRKHSRISKKLGNPETAVNAVNSGKKKGAIKDKCPSAFVITIKSRKCDLPNLRFECLESFGYKSTGETVLIIDNGSCKQMKSPSISQ